MKTIDISKATGRLRDYAADAKKGTLVITRRGKPVAAVIDADLFDYESLSLSENPEFIEIIAASRARYEKEGGISSDEVRRRLGLPPARARRKTRSTKPSTAKNG